MNTKWLGLGLVLLTSWQCETAFTPDSIDQTPELVVEGYIEAGEQALPPYVILTRDLPFFSRLDQESLEDTYVHDAVITVDDGEQVATLTELCLDELTQQQKQLAQGLFGIDTDSIGFNVCLYLDLTFSLQGEVGKTYELSINAEGQQLNAVTTIPPHVAPDSLFFQPPPGEPTDTLARLICRLNDPGGQANFYRYQAEINDEGLVSPFFSVLDDRLFDGQVAEFPLDKPEPRGTDEIDINTFGLFRVGNTVTIKWSTIDQTHYAFWNTLEFGSANQGPFSNYTRVQSNINGGLGIWGGIAASYHELQVQL